MLKTNVRSPMALLFGLAYILFVALPAMAAESKPAFIRISVSPEVTLFVQFLEKEMRMATTAERLAQATPVKAVSDKTEQGQRQFRFPAVALPVPAEALPAGVTKVQATFQVLDLGPGAGPRGSLVFGELAQYRADKAGAEWLYMQRLGLQASATSDKAPEIQLADLEKVSLTVVTKADRERKLGIGLRVAAGKSELNDIRKNGQPVEAQIRVLDSAGKEVASEKGPLNKFSFG